MGNSRREERRILNGANIVRHRQTFVQVQPDDALQQFQGPRVFTRRRMLPQAGMLDEIHREILIHHGTINYVCCSQALWTSTAKVYAITRQFKRKTYFSLTIADVYMLKRRQSPRSLQSSAQRCSFCRCTLTWNHVSFPELTICDQRNMKRLK